MSLAIVIARRGVAARSRGHTVNEIADKDAEVNAIALEIEQYLEKHPRSKDSLEGIRSWWLTCMPLAATSFKVERALERLIQRGVVSKEILPDNRVIYSSARAKPIP